MYQDDLSIIIQGPLDSTSVDNIDNYTSFGRVIVSCWIGCDDALMKKLINIRSTNSRVEIILNEELTDDSIGDYYNYNNIYRQSISTYNGLLACKTRYAVKTRSDEMVEDLSTLIHRLRENDDKVITSDIFFRKDGQYKFHASDHLMCGKSDLLLKAFGLAIDFCRGGISYEWKPTTPEQIITVSILTAKGIKVQPLGSRDLMVGNFYIIPFTNEYFKKVLWSSSSKEVLASSENWLEQLKEANNISNINDL